MRLISDKTKEYVPPDTKPSAVSIGEIKSDNLQRNISIYHWQIVILSLQLPLDKWSSQYFR